MSVASSTLAIEGYAQRAVELIDHYESINPATLYAPVFDLLPTAMASVLDIGAGTGRDAAWFAEMGHRVVAVEPVSAFVAAGIELHGPDICWIRGDLPSLRAVRDIGKRFDLITLIGVWQHISPEDRAGAWMALAELAAPKGLLLLRLRHGPLPKDRPGYPISTAQTMAEATAHGFVVHRKVDTGSIARENQFAGVTWTWLALRRKGEVT